MKRVWEEISATDRCATHADMGRSAFSGGIGPAHLPSSFSTAGLCVDFSHPLVPETLFFICLRHSSGRFSPKC